MSSENMKLNVKLGSIHLKNPFILASGILGQSWSQLQRAIKAGFGAVTTKSHTVRPKEGYKTPVITYTPCGIINAVGLENPGYKALAILKQHLKHINTPIIISLAGSTPDEFKLMTEYVDQLRFEAIELNLSCPHVRGYGLEIGDDPRQVYEIVRQVSSVTSIPIYVKVGLHKNLLETVGKALEAGAEGITAINTIKAMAIDIYAKKPVLSNIYGGLSGPAIHPIAVRVVYEIYKEYHPPIIGVGGVHSWIEAVEFILAGASAVGIGSAIAYSGLNIIKKLIKSVENYMAEEGFNSVEEMIGFANI